MSPVARKKCSVDDRAGSNTSKLLMAGRCASYMAGKTLQWAAATCLALATLPATAATKLNLEIGRSYMDSYGTTAAFAEAVFDQRRIGNSRFSWSPDASVGWIDGRGIGRFRSCRYSTNDSAWLVAGGIRLHYGDDADWYRSLFFSFQPALQSGRTQALSSAYEFVSTLGWQGRHFNIQIRHISNGSMHEPNRGETMALVGVTLDL